MWTCNWLSVLNVSKDASEFYTHRAADKKKKRKYNQLHNDIFVKSKLNSRKFISVKFVAFKRLKGFCRPHPAKKKSFTWWHSILIIWLLSLFGLKNIFEFSTFWMWINLFFSRTSTCYHDTAKIAQCLLKVKKVNVSEIVRGVKKNTNRS